MFSLSMLCFARHVVLCFIVHNGSIMIVEKWPLASIDTSFVFILTHPPVSNQISCSAVHMYIITKILHA